MALKQKVTKVEFDALPSLIRAEYKEQGEGYVLDVEGAEDVGALLRAKQHEKEARQEAERKAQEAAARATATQEELDNVRRGAIPKGDVEALETSWRTKLETATANHAAEVAKRDRALENATVDSAARALATTISSVPDLMLPIIKGRLKVELTDAGSITRVLDADGKPSALTVDDLAKEFKANPAYASVMIGSKASGGGANGGGSNGGASGKKLSDMSEKERVELYRSNPDEFKRLTANKT